MKILNGEKVAERLLALATFVCGCISALIFFFLLYFALPLIHSGGMGRLLTRGWDPANQLIGIFPMILGTVYIAGLALLLAVPIAIGLAAFIHLFVPSFVGRILRWVVELMTGIPTVVYGFAALFLLVPVVRSLFHYGTGLCILTASCVLALLILPTIVLLTLDSFNEVPGEYILAAQALGATPLQIFLHVLVPGAWPGITSAIVLGAGRATGDTLIALMLAGNAVSLPGSLLDPARTLTSHIALVSAADYESISFKAIFACGLVLFVFSCWNVLFLRIVAKFKSGIS